MVPILVQGLPSIHPHMSLRTFLSAWQTRFSERLHRLRESSPCDPKDPYFLPRSPVTESSVSLFRCPGWYRSQTDPHPALCSSKHPLVEETARHEPGAQGKSAKTHKNFPLPSSF